MLPLLLLVLLLQMVNSKQKKKNKMSYLFYFFGLIMWIYISFNIIDCEPTVMLWKSFPLESEMQVL